MFGSSLRIDEDAEADGQSHIDYTWLLITCDYCPCMHCDHAALCVAWLEAGVRPSHEDAADHTTLSLRQGAVVQWAAWQARPGAYAEQWPGVS